MTADRGTLPTGWVWTHLGEIATEPQYGWTTSAANTGKLHLLRTSDITSGHAVWADVPYCREEPPYASKYLLHDDDIVVSRAGSVGYSYRVKGPPRAIFASYLIRFRPLVVPAYLEVFLKSPMYWAAIRESSVGIALANVNASKLKGIAVPLPPFAEQDRIVARIEELFTRLDAGVEALTKIKTQLKRYRQAVLKHAFEGKLTAEWRQAHQHELEPASDLLERMKQERRKTAKGEYREPPPLDTSGLPELPEGWMWARIGDISEAVQYGYTASATPEAAGPRMLRITDIQKNSVVWYAVPYCRIETEEKAKYLLKDGDLLFARTGATVGKSFLIEDPFPESVFASYLIRITLPRHVSKRYVYSFFQSHDYWMQIYARRVGIGQPSVNSVTLSRILVPLSPIPEQHRIVEEIERRFSVADQIEKTVEQGLRQAERLRQSILKRAFEGKLVPQDPNDEPAEILLERIREERASLQAGAKSKKTTRKRTTTQEMRLM